MTTALVLTTPSLGAHGGLRRSDPAPGSALGASPKSIRLFFSERPEVSLSEIAVVDLKGAAYHDGQPAAVRDDPLSLIVPVRQLERGVYIVNWRVVSAVDGHITTGRYSFGVGVVPTIAATTSADIQPPTPLELGGRWLLLTGLILLTGATMAAAIRLGSKHDIAVAFVGWIVTLAGLALFAFAQVSNADVSITALTSIAIGRALLWRALAILSAGIALLFARARPARHREACAVAAVAAALAVAIHAVAGHAATSSGWQLFGRVLAQWIHIVALGVWLGGLLALLVAVRGEPSEIKATAIRRFSRIAAVALLMVVVTGVVRSYGELLDWRDLIAADYGKALSLKVGVTAAIAVLAAVNRWYSVPRAEISLRPLRRTGSAELGFATIALAGAAALGTLPPPASGFVAPRPLVTSGADFATSVRVELRTESDQPGPNQFTLHARDYDSREPIVATNVVLQFAAMDDPEEPVTSLSLDRAKDGTYVGTGANLAFDGRWQITALIQRGADSVLVPLQLDVAGAAVEVLPRREPSGKLYHVAFVPYVGMFRLDLEAERPGATALTVGCYDRIFERRSINSIVVTHESSDSQIRQLSMRRINQFQFASDVVLSHGANRIVIVTRGADGSRTRVVFDLAIGS
jgi:copper transport protein